MSSIKHAPSIANTRGQLRAAMLLVLLLAIAPGLAWSKCSFSGGDSKGTYTVDVPATIVNDPAIPQGSVLYTSAPTAINHRVDFNCNSSGSNGWGLVNDAGTTPPVSENLFPIGTTGVSYRVIQTGNYIYPYPFFDLGNGNWYEQDLVTLELVKTGPIADGSFLQGQLASFKAGNPGNYILDAVITLANRLTFTAPACTANASVINVALPTVTTQAFTGVGSVTGLKSFQIALTCSSGATVRITLDTTTPVAGKPGVIAPSSGSTSGIGVQLLDSSGMTPVSFGVPRVIGATPNGVLNVDYVARYYQTGATVSAGSLGATATFTLSYQ